MAINLLEETQQRLARALTKRIGSASVMPFEFRQITPNFWKVIDPETGSYISACVNSNPRMARSRQFTVVKEHMNHH